MIHLIKGSIFDSKCDLIIIPCNSLGGVTRSILNDLMVNDLPYFRKEMAAGDISFIQNTGTFSNASMIGYAASGDIDVNKSNENILKKILQQIKYCCQEQSLHKVNIPLLGTGAGGLSAKTSYNLMKSVFENDSNISLWVYAFSEDFYNKIIEEDDASSSNCIKNPRVFISYTGADKDNRNWVKNLACKLRSNGVDARLDIFHLKPGQDLPQWMTNELLMADKVLLICDKHYAEKADNRKGGVGWETMIIQGDMLSRQEQNKYVAILRDADIDKGLPIFVKSKYALNWSDNTIVEKDFDELLLYLFDCDIEPPIGPIPANIQEKLTKKD
ncbi:MAG: TIR domain-containing protein [Oscillospiraceae bacterium]|jgi:hypothetical protein|nr:TIR domain-containing protein [Oscillospiraceae bacterium]